MSKSRVIADTVISVILFCAGVAIGSQASEFKAFYEVILWGSMFGGIVYAWRILNFFTPNIFLFMPLVGWVIYFAVKFLISLFIAPFAFFIKTVMNIITLVK